MRIEKIEEIQRNIWFMGIFLISLLFCVFVPRYMISGTFRLWARPRDGSEAYSFTVNWSEFLQIICLGPLFGVIYFILMKFLLIQVDVEQGKNKYYVWAIEIGVLLLICINCMGHVFHLAFDAVNAVDKSKGVGSGSYNDYDTRDMFIFIWYMDEWLGHTLVHISYFGYLVLAVLAELLAKDHKKLERFELILIIPCIIGIGVMDGWVALKSECAFFLLILHIIFTISALFVIYLKKIKILEYPILLAMLLSIIPVVVFNVHFILTEGIKSYYPFYSSNLF